MRSVASQRSSLVARTGFFDVNCVPFHPAPVICWAMAGWLASSLALCMDLELVSRPIAFSVLPRLGQLHRTCPTMTLGRRRRIGAIISWLSHWINWSLILTLSGREGGREECPLLKECSCQRFVCVCVCVCNANRKPTEARGLLLTAPFTTKLARGGKDS